MLFSLPLVVIIVTVLSISAPATTEVIPLRWFIRLAGSLNSNQASVAYINGTVYARRPGTKLERLFLYEGYNIAHQIPQSDGSFWSETREIVFYRDPVSRVILQVWENPFSSQPNEVFKVANDPVNSKVTTSRHIQIYRFPNDGPLCVPLDFVLQYPNPLDVKNYPRYSAGPTYQAVELFQYHGNASQVSSEQVVSAHLSVTWTRKSQWMPWMAMGTTPGYLYFAAFSWKLVNGVKDLPKDILDIVTEKFPKFLKPPAVYDVPNESSWVTFKKTIDARRAAGQPDIMITPQNVTKLKSYSAYVDPDLVRALLSQPISVAWNGSLFPDILNITAFPLLTFTGSAKCHVTIVRGGYLLSVDATGEFRDPKTGEVLTNWFNPIAKKSVNVPKFSYSGSQVIGEEAVYSMDISPRKEIGLNVISSDSNRLVKDEDWRADFFQVIFRKDNPTSQNFYGTWMRYSSWLPWMNMADVLGSLICRLHVYSDL